MTSTDHTGERADFAGIQALSSRPAGYAVALKCLEVQSAAEAMDPSLKSAGHVILHETARSWYIGAIGEMAVGRHLATLGPEWFVRHAVPIGAGTKDIDHLVIGPGGVFAINTKHHADANIWVVDHMLGIGNSKTRHLSDGRRDGLDVAKRLAARVSFVVPVRPVVAVFHARSLIDRRPQLNRPVAVVEASDLVRWLTAQPQQLSDAKLSLLKLAAEEPTTWHIDPRAADTLRVMQRFDRLVGNIGPLEKRPIVVRNINMSPSRQRKPAVQRMPSRQPTNRPPTRSPTLLDMMKLWFTVAIVVVALLAFRSVANQPCVSPTGCLAPALYLGLRPVLELAGLLAVGAGMLGTLIWLASKVFR
jgi:hypothetical protein